MTIKPVRVHLYGGKPCPPMLAKEYDPDNLPKWADQLREGEP